MASLTRTLRLGMRGKDVEALKRAVIRYLGDGRSWRQLVASAPVVRRTYGPLFRRLVNRAHAKAGTPQSGVIGPRLEARLRAAGAFDAKADRLLAEYAAAVTPKPPARPPLIEPRQGFGSLHESLWEAYSIGRRMGLTDLGTYNPDSRLPGGGKSDHAFLPAYAFDLGFTPATGYQHPVARRFFREMVGRLEVNYVIVGNKIWSRELGEHHYTQGGHEGHVHVSGRRQ
ncbi:hypothetical protein Gocc_2921 [Gaiella occulta]|uniref:Uncharacterized protein n=1 Tax=Gaiella occulta TaxID=1002870 RepID=A0A7M2YT30_9ACTN|nr:hypothetical protein [Gaiella occulta]RDI73321.1 hypothetical protein Gocc_2921 [Gaiella occulta]